MERKLATLSTVDTPFLPSYLHPLLPLRHSDDQFFEPRIVVYADFELRDSFSNLHPPPVQVRKRPCLANLGDAFTSRAYSSNRTSLYTLPH